MSAQDQTIANIQGEAWFLNPANDQVMLFGSLPSWAVKLADKLPLAGMEDQASSVFSALLLVHATLGRQASRG